MFTLNVAEMMGCDKKGSPSFLFIEKQCHQHFTDAFLLYIRSHRLAQKILCIVLKWKQYKQRQNMKVVEIRGPMYDLLYLS